MDKETLMQNIITNYGSCGITRQDIEPLIDSGIAEGFTYDFIYLQLKAELSKFAGEEFYCTSEDMARAFNMSVDEMDRIIEESREELIAAGEDPDEYFKQVEVQRFMM